MATGIFRRNSSPCNQAVPQQNEGAFTGFGDEVMIYVFSFLSKQDLDVAVLVSRNWKRLSRDKVLLSKAEEENNNPDDDYPVRNRMDWAASFGYVSLMGAFVTDLHFPYDSLTYHHAAVSGVVDALVWLDERECLREDRWEDALRVAAMQGHLDVLKYLDVQGCPWDLFDLCEIACFGGYVSILDWLEEKGLVITSEQVNPLYEATLSGEDRVENLLSLLDWLYVRGGSPSEQIYEIAIKHTVFFGVLNWLKDHRCPWNKQKCLEIAQSRGDREILNWVEAQPVDFLNFDFSEF